MLKTLQKTSSFIRFYNSMSKGLQLSEVVAKLDTFAPLSYAEKWDNVGLLLEPYNKVPIERILLTNDLTEAVVEEAVEQKINLIISYHPPIFQPLRRITQKTWKERIVSICLAKSIAVYSPHTAWDAKENGVTDWLASAVPYKNIKPIKPSADSPNVGVGRTFTADITLENAVESVKKLTGFDVQIALANSHTPQTEIKTVAVCPGSGGSVLRGFPADLYISGEMSHHDILDANHNGVSVILCNHSNSERGFLKEFRQKLAGLLNNSCEVTVSKKDKDPLRAYSNIDIDWFSF